MIDIGMEVVFDEDLKQRIETIEDILKNNEEKIVRLKSRLNKAESKVLDHYAGVPNWCMKLAQDALRVDPWRLDCLKGMSLGTGGQKTGTPD